MLVHVLMGGLRNANDVEIELALVRTQPLKEACCRRLNSPSKCPMICRIAREKGNSRPIEH